jgi:basic membrane lipoprotein Med (substrate-binding protein (PBP1-ABC) superfamily)/DNA-binding SARP family transcriptional activator
MRSRREGPVSSTGFGTHAYHGSMRFEVLGSMRVVVAVSANSGPRTRGTPPTASEPSLGGPKQRFVLARLLAEPNRVVSVDRIVDGLWGDDPPESARHTVQGYVSELRKAVGSLIERNGAGYLVRASPDTLDSLDFEMRVTAARALAPTDPAGAADALAEALALWRGAAFAEFHDGALQAEAARLEELRLAATEELMQARLDAGQHGDVIAELDRLTREHPYREELRALHMVALYRSGRQADALRAYRTTRTVLDDDLGIVPSPRLRRLEEQILLQDPELDLAATGRSSPSATDRHVENPYLGLRAFREADHARFFGQDQLVDRLVARVLGEERFTAVVGPSGSGKSSVVQAGVVPRIRDARPDVLVAQMQPGAHPFEALDAALGELPEFDRSELDPSLADDRDMNLDVLPAGGERPLLLVVDQFEELFTTVDGSEASRFLRRLSQLATDDGLRVHVLVTLRADFYDRPLADPHIGRLFADNVVNAVGLAPDQLESAATQPARQLDISIEPRLVGRLIADVAGQPNALPLFQYALTELFDARDGPVLDLETYERIGGVRKAVARRAESLYSQLDATEQDAARQLFLRIATVSGDIVGRRRVPASELVALDVDVVALRTAIDTFARYRLLALDRDPATGSPTIEVAHEALLSEWHRLRDWIDQHRDDLTKQASFVVAVNEWESSGRDPGYLLTGSRLDGYERWAATTGLRLTVTEHDFITAGVTARDAALVDHRQRDDEQRRLQRRSRHQLVALFAVVAVFAAILSYPRLTPDAPREAVVLVLDAPRDATEFERLLVRSVESGVANFGLDILVIEPPYTDLVDELRRVAAQRPALMFGAFTVHDSFLQIAADHPDTTFALIDAIDTDAGPNVVTVNVAVEQGTYLVGAAAALVTQTGRIGYIGANPQPFIEEFRAGFEQGAVAVDPGIEIAVDLVDPPFFEGDETSGGYVDPDAAYEIAAEMYGGGADVIFVAAGESGRGVIEAAAELSTPDRKLWAIGVDTDEYFEFSNVERDHLLTSMYKRFDLGIEAVIAAHVAGDLTGAGSITLDLADQAVGYTATGGHLTPDTIEVLESLRAGIVDGSIVVETTPSALPPIPGPFVLDLRTGARTPLPDELGAAGHYWASPDGSQIAFGRCCNDDDTITIANIDGTDVRPLSPPDGFSQHGVGWSPDGTRIVYQEHVGTMLGDLFVEDLATGEKSQITDLESTAEDDWWWLAPRFSPDGEHVVFHLPREGAELPGEGAEAEGWDVWSVPVDGGVPTLLVPDAMFPIYFPDGETLAVIDPAPPDFSGRVISIVAADGSRSELIAAEEPVWAASVSADGTRIAFEEGSRIHVVDVATGESTTVAEGISVSWLDDDRLFVHPGAVGWPPPPPS